MALKLTAKFIWYSCAYVFLSVYEPIIKRVRRKRLSKVVNEILFKKEMV